MTVGAYPGSFNPPTVAHLAIADAARRVMGLERVDFVVSRVALGKEDVAVPSARSDRRAGNDHLQPAVARRPGDRSPAARGRGRRLRRAGARSRQVGPGR
ncbi:MAG: hypothetical protein J2P57_21470 [Acidimicrobiaceae bacterium]|nr:hypothetical protein [Acidimicrobiaceae bacterium]